MRWIKCRAFSPSRLAVVEVLGMVSCKIIYSGPEACRRCALNCLKSSNLHAAGLVRYIAF